MASSEIEAIKGTIRIPTPRPAASRFDVSAVLNRRFTNWGVMKLRANTPTTTLGIPARISSVGFRRRLAFALAYSLR